MNYKLLSCNKKWTTKIKKKKEKTLLDENLPEV